MRVAAFGALWGALLALVTPLTLGIAGFALIVLPPVALRCAPGVCLTAVGAGEWAIVGFAVGCFIGAVSADRQVNDP